MYAALAGLSEREQMAVVALPCLHAAAGAGLPAPTSATPAPCPALRTSRAQQAEFAEERQLVLRSTWLCAGAESLADMQEKLQ